MKSIDGPPCIFVVVVVVLVDKTEPAGREFRDTRGIPVAGAIREVQSRGERSCEIGGVGSPGVCEVSVAQGWASEWVGEWVKERKGWRGGRGGEGKGTTVGFDGVEEVTINHGRQ